jgi:hypothetical protein
MIWPSRKTASRARARIAQETWTSHPLDKPELVAVPQTNRGRRIGDYRFALILRETVLNGSDVSG